MGYQLTVYWQEILPGEGIIAHWGQLGHAVLRLQFSVQEMESSFINLKNLKSIYRIHYQIENYHARAYELMERLCSIVSIITKNKNAKRMMFDPLQSKKVISAIPKSANDCIDPLKQIIKLLQNDINIRNVHTHRVFIRIGLYTGKQYIDIEDLYWDFEEDPATMGKIFDNIRKGGKRLVKEYRSKSDAIDKNVNLFLKGLVPYLHEVGV